MTSEACASSNFESTLSGIQIYENSAPNRTTQTTGTKTNRSFSAGVRGLLLIITRYYLYKFAVWFVWYEARQYAQAK
jgi:hypothetical protein